MSLTDFIMIKKYIAHNGKREHVLQGYIVCQNVGEDSFWYIDGNCKMLIQPNHCFIIPNHYYEEWQMRNEILDLPAVIVKKVRFIDGN